MIVSSALLADLKRQLALIETDLRLASDDPDVAWATALHDEYEKAVARGRTALTWSVWRDGEVAQGAVAWLIATVFVRFCEDNGLLVGHPTAGRDPVWLAGPGDRTALAIEREQAHYEKHPLDNSRDWLQQAFAALADLPAGARLVDREHNPVWGRMLITAPQADALLAFWRRRDDEGALAHDFADPALGTRFLGDLYQDLSEHAKKQYALLQTPVFVEEFILDRTLTPAMAEFGIAGLKLIDPTCGSGHFLLGAFARLVDAWAAREPALSSRERVQKTLDSVHGVDLNPFAVAIARFRLTVAALQASGDTTLTAAPDWRLHLAIGDSLLGEAGQQETLDLLGEHDEPFYYASEDVATHPGILRNGQYHVVVGNPPYITVKDKALNDRYRELYPDACAGKYALSAPFAEAFFRLARAADASGGAGYVGQITSNSFMKREFGKKLVEKVLSGQSLRTPVDLLAVLDTSGAYIPGHGTPTVILVGRRRRPTAKVPVRAVLGVRGEPGQPAEPAKGLVWTEITGHVDDRSYDGTYVTVTDLPRETLASHPWSLSGGGASELFTAIEEAAERRLDQALSMPIGFASFPGNDEPFFLGKAWFRRFTDAAPLGKGLIVGDVVRDWFVRDDEAALAPYDNNQDLVSFDPASSWGRHLWVFRSSLEGTTGFGGETKKDAGEPWWGWYRWVAERYRTPLSIAFAFVATHNHFVLDRGGKVFKQSAPVIKLPEGATEDDHLALLGVLNSSTACFWLKQVSHNKGSTVDEKGARQTTVAWENFYEFTGTKLQQFPLPSSSPIDRARMLDGLAQRLATVTPAGRLADIPDGMTLAAGLDEARTLWHQTRERLVFLQEELDWDVYSRYGLIDEDVTYSGDGMDAIALGERAFEIALARRVAAGEEETAWFERHGSTPITDIPSSWPEDYRDLVGRRLAAIEANPHLRLLERPEYKRRWATDPWEKQQEAALRAYALDRLERAELWRDAQGAVTLSVAQLADRVRGDARLAEALALLAGSAQHDVVATLTALVKDEAVPYLAAYRLNDAGMTKFREWQHVWDLQRREDAGQTVSIPVPPKYAQADFRSSAAWKARGKLDVPKERFVAYPNVARPGDPSPVIGWAGWDHADQAQALARVLLEQQALGASSEAVKPLLAGLAELEPWLHQWHTGFDAARGGSPAAAITALLDHTLATLGLTRTDLDAWRPPAAARGPRPRNQEN